MENKHIPVMIEEVKSYIPTNKKLNIIDATFDIFTGGVPSVTICFHSSVSISNL